MGPTIFVSMFFFFQSVCGKLMCLYNDTANCWWGLHPGLNLTQVREWPNSDPNSNYFFQIDFDLKISVLAMLLKIFTCRSCLYSTVAVLLILFLAVRMVCISIPAFQWWQPLHHVLVYLYCLISCPFLLVPLPLVCNLATFHWFPGS